MTWKIHLLSIRSIVASTGKLVNIIHGWMDGWMDGHMDRQMNGWVGGWMDGLMGWMTGDFVFFNMSSVLSG